MCGVYVRKRKDELYCASLSSFEVETPPSIWPPGRCQAAEILDSYHWSAVRVTFRSTVPNKVLLLAFRKSDAGCLLVNKSINDQ